VNIRAAIEQQNNGVAPSTLGSVMQRCRAVLIANVYERCIGIEARTKVPGLATLCEMVNRVIRFGSDAAAFFACLIEQFGDFFMPAVPRHRGEFSVVGVPLRVSAGVEK
jgi:hypothetical protein